MHRRAEFRPFSWLNDLRKRNQLDLDPPYQRRTVWPNKYRSDFVTTALLNYPCPAIFLYEEIKADGTFFYKVVDGKQRLTSLFDFVSDKISVSQDYPNTAYREMYFSQLPDHMKLEIWRYAFAVEFIEQENESLINDIFNRINKNVAKLTNQELRHAQFSGRFIQAAEGLSERLEASLTSDFPRIAPQSRRQMKDVENVSTLLLFIEQGERSLSQIDLDKAYSDRDEDWEREIDTTNEFMSAVEYIAEIVRPQEGQTIFTSRLRNQADFYSLFGAIVELTREKQRPPVNEARKNLIAFIDKLKAAEGNPNGEKPDLDYLTAARSASNDPTPRRIRIDRIKHAILNG